MHTEVPQMHAFITFKTTHAQLLLSKPLMHNMSPPHPHHTQALIPYKYMQAGSGFGEKVKKNNKAVCRKEEVGFLVDLPFQGHLWS